MKTSLLFKNIFPFVLIYLFFLLNATAQTTSKIENIDNYFLLQRAKNIENVGTLKVDAANFVYLAVSDQFKTKLFPLLYRSLNDEDKSCLIPAINQLGEHITLFPSGILNAEQIGKLPKDKEFHFKIVKILKLNKKDTLDNGKIIYTQWYVLQIKSPELLEFLKELYPEIDLSKKILHISFGVAKFDDSGVCQCMCEPIPRESTQ